MTNLPPGVVPGGLVIARGTRWRVAACVGHGDCRELHLRGMAGESRTLLWPFDRAVAVASRSRLRVVPPLKWLRRARHLAASGRGLTTPRARFRGDILPYQLEPALAVASGAARVLLADEVGLGKTIQAGWILADLLSREPDARALIAVPASLRDQWAGELETLFTIVPFRVDAAWLRAAAASRAADVSPWAAPGAYLGSIDFLKRPDVSASLGEPVWDLVVVDEAHAAAAPTERHAALARVALTARRVVIISATPYSGDAAAFSSMVSLGALPGDPEPLLFRRSRADVGDRRARRHRFAVVRITTAEARLQRLLERYTSEVWAHAPGEVESARLAMTVLRKRALSSPAAALRSLSRRLELLRDAPTAPRQLSLFDEEPQSDDLLPEAALATPGLADVGVEARWLATLVEAAQRAVPADSKLRYVRRLIDRVRDEPIIVFTEYRDTLRQLSEIFPAALQLHGGLTPAERATVQSRFNTDGGMLLATDAAADGLNLQRRCRLVLNFELPWNPARLEQRIGRVDRIGQRRRVHAISLVARDTAEDLVVAALARRLTRVSATLGEHDRLAAFLSEARTARAVIGGDSNVLNDEEAPAPVLPRPAPGTLHATEVAAELRRRLPVSTARVVPVGCWGVRASDGGAIVLVRTALVNDSGSLAERVIAVHVNPERLGAAETLTLAERARAIAERSAPALADVLDWRDDVVRRHRAAIESRLGRERAMAGAAEGRALVQPGLFDRRTVDAHLHLKAVETGRDAGHAEHVRQLTLALDVRVDCAAVAVLIPCR